MNAAGARWRAGQVLDSHSGARSPQHDPASEGLRVITRGATGDRSGHQPATSCPKAHVAHSQTVVCCTIRQPCRHPALARTQLVSEITDASPALSQGSATLRRMRPPQDRQGNGSGGGAGRSLGYARVSTAEQHLDL